jgi:hypothetical protein
MALDEEKLNLELPMIRPDTHISYADFILPTCVGQDVSRVETMKWGPVDDLRITRSLVKSIPPRR